MRKKLLSLFLALMCVLSTLSLGRYTAFADEENTGDTFTSTYYYDSYSNSAFRTIYNKINSAAKAFTESTGDASYTESGDYIAFVLNIDYADYEVVKDAGLSKIYNSVMADHPEYFWMDEHYSSQTKSTGGQNNGGAKYLELTVRCLANYAGGATRQVAKNNMDIVASTYAANINPNATPQEKVYHMHNALIEDTTFAADLNSGSKYGEKSYAFTADGVFNSKYKLATCEGYARAFKYMMDKVGVTCVIIPGEDFDYLETTVEAEKQHAKEGIKYNTLWNAVRIENQWYLISLGLDDPITTTGKDVLAYDYFMITSKDASNLTPDTNRLPAIPTCEGTTYNLTKIKEQMEQAGEWQKTNYNFFDKLLDTYGLSVVLISIGLILLLVVALINRMAKNHKKHKSDKLKNTKTKVIDNSELDRELRTPPLS